MSNSGAVACNDVTAASGETTTDSAGSRTSAGAVSAASVIVPAASWSEATEGSTVVLVGSACDASISKPKPKTSGCDIATTSSGDDNDGACCTGVGAGARLRNLDAGRAAGGGIAVSWVAWLVSAETIPVAVCPTCEEPGFNTACVRVACVGRSGCTMSSAAGPACDASMSPPKPNTSGCDMATSAAASGWVCCVPPPTEPLAPFASSNPCSGAGADAAAACGWSMKASKSSKEKPKTS
mmetsp:Transcript_116116/g.231526  ORF Transcript_116116/g.231526 Transcript_116116/m.231526 type:complete len:239 (-) Transcript_116116:1826-2542(-)